MNFDNMEPDYKKDEESDLQKMARQTNKNVFLAVTAGVFTWICSDNIYRFLKHGIYYS